MTWPNPTQGSHTISVTATDSYGETATSQLSVTVLVGTPAPGVYYVYADQTATPRMIVRPLDNQAVWRWDGAEPFGATPATVNPSGLGQFSYDVRFPGQVFDSETGLSYNYFRNYDPMLGRYVQADPIGLLAGINTYAYVGGSPLNLVDPLGLYCLTEQQINIASGAAGGALAGGAALAEFGPLGIATGVGLGAVTGGVFGALTPTGIGSSSGVGAGIGANTGLNTPISGAVGGISAGAITYGLQQAGVPDSVALPLGGFLGGAIAGDLGNIIEGAATTGYEGGWIGAAAGATSAAVAAALRAGNACPCGSAP